MSSPVVEEAPPIDAPMTMPTQTSDTLPLPGSDRQTRGFRVYIEPKTHTITRTNKKQKVIEKSESSTASDIKQEPVEINHGVSETSSSSTSSTTNPAPPVQGSSNRRKSFLSTKFFILETKRSRIPKKKRSLSPPVVSSPVRSSEVPFSPNKTKRNRRSTPQSQTPNVPIPKVEPLSAVPPLRTTTYSIPPPIDPRNPLTWNVDDVCWYLNECGCSFALKTIKEQVTTNEYIHILV